MGGDVILTDEDIEGISLSAVSVKDAKADARAVEAAVLEKLAGMGLPEPAIRDYYGSGYTAAQLYQAFAHGARCQLSAIKTLEHLGYINCGGEYWKPPLGKR